MLAYIDDGYTEQIFIQGIPGMYPDLRATVRPVLPREVAAHYRAMEQTTDETAEQVAADWAATRIVQWNVVDKGNRPIGVTGHVLANLRPKLFYRLLKILRGEEAPDLDPSLSPENIKRELADREKAHKAQLELSQFKAEQNAKNSPPA